MLHSVQCDDIIVPDDLIHQAPSVLSQRQVFLDHSTTSRLILKTMMSGVPHHLR